MITARTVLQQGNILQHHITHGYVLSLSKVSLVTARSKCFSAADPIDRSCSVLRVNVGEEAIGNVLRTLSDCSAETTAHCVAAAEVVPRLNDWLLYLLQWAWERVTLMTLRKRDGEVCVRVYHAMWMWHHLPAAAMEFSFPSSPVTSAGWIFVAHACSHAHAGKDDCTCFASFNTCQVILSWKDCSPFFPSHIHNAVGLTMVLKSTQLVIKFQMLNLLTWLLSLNSWKQGIVGLGKCGRVTYWIMENNIAPNQLDNLIFPAFCQSL